MIVEPRCGVKLRSTDSRGARHRMRYDETTGEREAVTLRTLVVASPAPRRVAGALQVISSLGLNRLIAVETIRTDTGW